MKTSHPANICKNLSSYINPSSPKVSKNAGYVKRQSKKIKTPTKGEKKNPIESNILSKQNTKSNNIVECKFNEGKNNDGINEFHSDTSSNFLLKSEFIHLWNEFAKSDLLNNFIIFENEPQILYVLINQMFYLMNNLIQTFIESLYKQISSLLNIPQSQTSLDNLSKTIKPFFKEYLDNIFCSDTLVTFNPPSSNYLSNNNNISSTHYNSISQTISNDNISNINSNTNYYSNNISSIPNITNNNLPTNTNTINYTKFFDDYTKFFLSYVYSNLPNKMDGDDFLDEMKNKEFIQMLNKVKKIILYTEFNEPKLFLNYKNFENEKLQNKNIKILADMNPEKNFKYSNCLKVFGISNICNGCNGNNNEISCFVLFDCPKLKNGFCYCNDILPIVFCTGVACSDINLDYSKTLKAGRTEVDKGIEIKQNVNSDKKEGNKKGAQSYRRNKLIKNKMEDNRLMLFKDNVHSNKNNNVANVCNGNGSNFITENKSGKGNGVMRSGCNNNNNNYMKNEVNNIKGIECGTEEQKKKLINKIINTNCNLVKERNKNKNYIARQKTDNQLNKENLNLNLHLNLNKDNNNINKDKEKDNNNHKDQKSIHPKPKESKEKIKDKLTSIYKNPIDELIKIISNPQNQNKSISRPKTKRNNPTLPQNSIPSKKPKSSYKLNPHLHPHKHKSKNINLNLNNKSLTPLFDAQSPNKRTANSNLINILTDNNFSIKANTLLLRRKKIKGRNINQTEDTTSSFYGHCNNQGTNIKTQNHNSNLDKIFLSVKYPYPYNVKVKEKLQRLVHKKIDKVFVKKDSKKIDTSFEGENKKNCVIKNKNSSSLGKVNKKVRNSLSNPNLLGGCGNIERIIYGSDGEDNTENYKGDEDGNATGHDSGTSGAGRKKLFNNYYSKIKIYNLQKGIKNECVNFHKDISDL